MQISHVMAGMAAALVGLASAEAFAADAAKGKTVYEACAACHTEKPDALGPSLKGVIGRKSGARDDFRYSNAMKRANLTWDEANLKAYILDPQAKIPGNRMPFGGLPATQIDDVIAYMATLK